MSFFYPPNPNLPKKPKTFLIKKHHPALPLIYILTHKLSSSNCLSGYACETPKPRILSYNLKKLLTTGEQSNPTFANHQHQHQHQHHYHYLPQKIFPYTGDNTKSSPKLDLYPFRFSIALLLRNFTLSFPKEQFLLCQP